MNRFLTYGLTVAEYSNIDVAPVAGSPLAQAVNIILPKHELKDEEELATGLENAIDQTLVDFVGGYGDIAETMVNELLDVSCKRLEFIQTTVAPLSSRFAERVAENLKSNLDATTIIDYDIVTHELPRIATSGSLEGICDQYIASEGFGNKTYSPSAYFIDEEEDVLISSLESGIAAWDDEVKEILVAAGEEGMTRAYNRFLNNIRGTEVDTSGNNVVTYPNNIDYLNDYILCFLFVNSALLGGYENKDKMLHGRYNIDTVLRKTAGALGTSIKSIITNYARSVETNRVIRSIDHENSIIQVFKTNFSDYVANGGEAEVLKMGALLASEGHGGFLKMTTEELLENSQKAIAMFNAKISKIESDAISSALTKSKMQIITIFKEVIEATSELELHVTNKADILTSSKVHTLLEEISLEDFENRPREIALEIFCKVVWPQASFWSFIQTMNAASLNDPSLTPREAAYKAFVKEVVSNLLKQTAVVNG